VAALGDAREALEALRAAARSLGERHGADHEMAYASRVLGLALDEALQVLDEQADRLGAAGEGRGTGRLADLRRLLAAAGDASTACLAVAQGATAAREAGLADAASAAQGAAERARRWGVTKLKATAAQVLALRGPAGGPR
jgi:hypothetical protein